ncbi:uncharacterized protein LOC120337800 [Styela clava]
MHAISPQMMVWDPSSVGLPPQATDMQAPVLAPGFQTVLPHAYRIAGAVPQMYASASVQNPAEHQGIVWVQQSQIINQDHTTEDFETGAQVFTHGVVPGQIPMVPQHNMMPVIMTINGQRVLAHQPITQIQSPQNAYYQMPEHGTMVQQPHEGLHLVNIAGINQRMQQGVRLTSLPHPHDMMPTTTQPIQNIQEKQQLDRPRLTPRRRNGSTVFTCDTVASWRRVSEERSLGGLNTAIRRRSQSADRDANEESTTNTAESPTPNKRAATTYFPIMNNIENQSEFWRAPDARILRKLIDIIEYYFSDECLTRNGYMLKQISSTDSDGYISLRRVAALKRVKSQTRDLRTVAYAVRQSDKLEMDEEGTMIRRKRPLPENIEAPRFIRSVLAINLPNDSPSVEDVTSLFTPYGDLTQVRVLRPGKSIPSYLKEYTAWVPDLGSRVCAVVEFENQDEAQKACREINMQNRGQNTLRVALLKPGARIRRTLYRKYKDDVVETNDDKPVPTATKRDAIDANSEATSNLRVRCASDSSDGSAHTEQKNSRINNNNVNNNKSIARYDYDASGSGSDTGSDTDSVGSKTGKYRIPVKPASGFDSRKKCQHSGDSGYSHSSSSDERDSVIGSPLLSRKSDETTKSGPGMFTASRRTSPIQKKFIDGVPVGVERQPKGPVADCKGFNNGIRQNLEQSQNI